MFTHDNPDDSSKYKIIIAPLNIQQGEKFHLPRFKRNGSVDTLTTNRSSTEPVTVRPIGQQPGSAKKKKMEITRERFLTSRNEEVYNTLVSEIVELKTQDNDKSRRIDEMANRHARMIREESERREAFMNEHTMKMIRLHTQEEQLSMMKDEYENKSKLVNRLVRTLEKDLKKREKVIEGLEMKNLEWEKISREREEDYLKKMKWRSDEIRQLLVEKQNIKQSQEMMAEDVSKLRQENQELRNEMMELRKGKKKAEDEVESLRKMCENLQRELTGVKEEEENWKQKYKLIDGELSVRTQEVFDLKKKNKEVQDLMEEEVMKVNRKNAAISKELGDCKADLERLKVENKEMKSGLEDMTKRAGMYKNEVDQLVENVNGKERKLEEMKQVKSSLKDLEGRFEQAENMLDKREKELNEMARKLAEVKEEKRVVEMQNEEMRIKILAVNAKNREMETDIDGKKERIKRLQELEVLIGEKEMKIQKVEAQLLQVGMELEEKNKEIVKREEEKNREIMKRDGVIQLKDQQILELKKEVEMGNMRLSRLEGESLDGQTKEELRRLRSENQNLSNIVNEHNDEVWKLRIQAAYRLSFQKQRKQVIEDADLRGYVKAAPMTQAYTSKELGMYLKRGANDDVEKAWVVFLWIAWNVVFDEKMIMRDKAKWEGVSTGNMADAVVRERRATSFGYSALFTELARAMGLEAEIVKGITKNYKFSQESKAMQKQVEHVWTRVKIGGIWYLCDPMWGAGFITNNQGRFKADLNDMYFLAMPSQFVMSHLPNEQNWQLLERPIGELEFEESVDYKDYYYKYGLELLDVERKVIESVDCMVRFRIRTPENVYLMTVVENADGKQETLSFVQGEDDPEEGRMNLVEGIFPVKGYYKLQVFARKGRNKGPYLSALEVMINSRSSVDNKKKACFPHVYSGFTDRRCYLYEPKKGAVMRGFSQKFRVRMPGATAASVMMGKAWKDLVRSEEDEEIFEGETRVDADTLVLYGKFWGSKNFEGMLGYKVY